MTVEQEGLGQMIGTTNHVGMIAAACCWNSTELPLLEKDDLQVDD